MTVLQGSAEDKEQAGLVLQEVLEAARIVAVMLSPVVPALARLIYLQLGYNDQQFETLTWQDAHWGGDTCSGIALLLGLLVLVLACAGACACRCYRLLCLLSVVGCFACLCVWSAGIAFLLLVNLPADCRDLICLVVLRCLPKWSYLSLQNSPLLLLLEHFCRCADCQSACINR